VVAFVAINPAAQISAAILLEVWIFIFVFGLWRFQPRKNHNHYK
jgi:hypothetical protein